MSAIRAARLPTEVGPDLPARRSDVWSAGSDCASCALAVGGAVGKLARSQAEAILATNCTLGQAASVVWAA
eukprot:10470271-Alexandrium_andersonii.AAC.1